MHPNEFTKNMAVYVERLLPAPTEGFYDGIDEHGTRLTGVGSLTNGLVLGASLYAIRNFP